MKLVDCNTIMKGIQVRCVRTDTRSAWSGTALPCRPHVPLLALYPHMEAAVDTPGIEGALYDDAADDTDDGVPVDEPSLVAIPSATTTTRTTDSGDV